ncbi:hypothetical protein ScPMuIL_002425 [Solemya velum]
MDWFPLLVTVVIQYFFGVGCVVHRELYFKRLDPLSPSVMTEPSRLSEFEAVPGFLRCALLCAGEESCLSISYAGPVGACILHGQIADSQASRSRQTILQGGPNKDYCSEKDGYLAEIKTEEETDFITQSLEATASESDKYWIGANDIEIEGNFTWEAVALTSYIPIGEKISPMMTSLTAIRTVCIFASETRCGNGVMLVAVTIDYSSANEARCITKLCQYRIETTNAWLP